MYTVHLQDPGQGDDGQTNYKSGQQFSQHMKEQSQAVSAFAKSKTIKQQREFLPIYAARQQVSATVLRSSAVYMYNIFLDLYGTVNHIVSFSHQFCWYRYNVGTVLYIYM